MTYEGSCNAELFEGWLAHVLLPKLEPGCVIIMDNAKWHKTIEVEQLIHDAGCEILFLAPYSPEDNPIEHSWANLKNYIRPKMAYYHNVSDAIDLYFRN